jgi:hypothetical protein
MTFSELDAADQQRRQRDEDREAKSLAARQAFIELLADPEVRNGVDTVAKAQELIDQMEEQIPGESLPPCYDWAVAKRNHLEKSLTLDDLANARHEAMQANVDEQLGFSPTPEAQTRMIRRLIELLARAEVTIEMLQKSCR